MADGTDLTATRKALHVLGKQEPNLANLAGVAARGGCWTGDRLARSDMGDAICPVCGVPDDVCHMVYECPKFKGLRCRQACCALEAPAGAGQVSRPLLVCMGDNGGHSGGQHP